MSGIDCAFYGFLASDAEARTSQAGKTWVRLRVGVGDPVQWVSVAVFGKSAAAAAKFKKADRIYCEGTIKLDTWRGSDGVDRHGLSVASFKIEKTHGIGRNRPKRDGDDKQGRRAAPTADSSNNFHSDDIGF
jgi:single-stranded DNA-binding protein